MRIKTAVISKIPFYDPELNCTIYNFRPCEIGSRTIFRSSLIDDICLTERQKYILLNKYQIKAIVDLRTPEEYQNNRLCSQDFEVYNIPFGKNVQAMNYSIGGYYKYLTDVMNDNQNEIKQILNLIQKLNCNLIFHCRAGIDRTGLVSALYLKERGYSLNHILKDFYRNFYYVYQGNRNDTLARLYNNKSFFKISLQLINKTIAFHRFVKNDLWP